jgi:DNA end-binding protein Ku
MAKKRSRAAKPAPRSPQVEAPATRRPAQRDGPRKKSAARGRGRTSEAESAAKELGARPVWSGHLRLALVSVPVKLFPATRSGARISFHQVHEPSGKRVRYQKMVPGVGPVDSEEIVKGYELDKGRYVLLKPEEIDAVKVEAKRTLDLVQFVDAAEIDPIWFDRPYFVVADGELAEEAYTVLRDALRSTQRIGLGQFVMRGREYIAALKPSGNGMLLETLRFADELREAAPYFAGVDEQEADEELLGLARELIERKTEPFEPARFEDRYTAALREVIDARASDASAAIEVEEEQPAAGGRIIDLVEALKRSVGSDPKGPTRPRNQRAG